MTQPDVARQIVLGSSDGGFVRPGEDSLVQDLERFNRAQGFKIIEEVVGRRGQAGRPSISSA